MKRFISVALLFWCTAVFAEEKKYSYLFTNDFTYQKSRLAGDPDQFYNSSSLFLKYGVWSGGMTLRAHNYYKQSTSFTLDPKVDLYRKYLRYASGNFEIQGGDFNAILGRGLVLSILQNEKVFRDRTILGGDFRFGSKKWQVRTLGGTVEDEQEEQKWGIAGAEISRDYWKGNRVGFYASYIHDRQTFQQSGDRLTWSVSFNSDKLPRGFSYYTEISRMNVDDPYIPDGSAYYGNVGWNRKNLTLLFEFKEYRNFDNGLNNPPSVDRGDEAVEMTSSKTVRLYSQYSLFSPDIITFVSVGKAWEAGIPGPQVYTGVNASELWGKVDFGMGYSYKDTLYPVKIIDGQTTFRFTDALAAGFSVRDKRYRQGDYRFNERDWMPQISWAPYGAVFFQRQYSQRLIDGHHSFNNYGIRMNIKRDSYIEFSTGRVRGGEVCASGQCFYAPPFRGWKVGVFASVR